MYHTFGLTVRATVNEGMPGYREPTGCTLLKLSELEDVKTPCTGMVVALSRRRASKTGMFSLVDYMTTKVRGKTHCGGVTNRLRAVRPFAQPNSLRYERHVCTIVRHC